MSGRHFSGLKIGNVFGSTATMSGVTVYWRLQMNSAGQIGLKTALKEVPIVDVRCSIDGEVWVGEVFQV